MIALGACDVQVGVRAVGFAEVGVGQDFLGCLVSGGLGSRAEGLGV